MLWRTTGSDLCFSIRSEQFAWGRAAISMGEGGVRGGGGGSGLSPGFFLFSNIAVADSENHSLFPQEICMFLTSKKHRV